MKKYLKILFFCILALASSAYAADVCVVIDHGDGEVDSKCLNVDENMNGYDFLQELRYTMEWTEESQWGSLLCRIKDTGPGLTSDQTNCASYDNMWNINLVHDNQWFHSPVGFGREKNCWDRSAWSDVFDPVHICVKDGDILGLAYGAWGYTPNLLKVNNIKVYVDDKKTSKADEEGGTIKVKPDSKLRLEIEIENLFEDSTKIEIKNIEAEAIIQEIDDGSEIEETSDSIDIDTEEEDTIELEFDIPLEVDHGNYDMELTIKGEDDNNIEYSKKIEFTVKVEKEKNELLIQEFELADTTLKCKTSTSIDFSVLNIGRNNADVELTITNDELGINIKDEFKLDDDPFDSDSQYTNTYIFNILEDIEEGIYPLTLTLDYEKEQEQKTVELALEGCNTELEETASENEDTISLEITTEESQSNTQAIVTPSLNEIESNSANNDILIIGVVLGAIVIAIILGVFLALKLVK